MTDRERIASQLEDAELDLEEAQAELESLRDNPNATPEDRRWLRNQIEELEEQIAELTHELRLEQNLV